MKNKLKNLKEQINDIGNFVGLKRIGIVIFLTFLSVIPNVYSTSSPNIWNSLFELGINHVYIIFLIAIISYNVIYMAEATKNSNFLIRYAGYKNYLKDQIKRLELMKRYYTKMTETTKEKTKAYYKEGIRLLLQTGETMENFEQVLEEYKSALIIRNKRIDDLYNEIKIIKRLKV